MKIEKQSLRAGFTMSELKQQWRAKRNAEEYEEQGSSRRQLAFYLKHQSRARKNYEESDNRLQKVFF